MIVRVLALLCAVCLASGAQAEVAWSIPGSGCVPTDVTTKFDRNKDGNASVQHAPNNVDLIILTCPIPRFTSGTTNWSLRLTYRDSTGTRPAVAFVRARLYRMPFGSATPGTPLATANSNSSSITTLNTVDSALFPQTFDFDTYIYWVRVDLNRAATNQTVIFHSVWLEGTPPISDIRAKHDIVLLGYLDTGLGFYRFSYNGSAAAYVGVMAQEVQAIMPDAVMLGYDGYLRVYYDRLGFRMQTWEDWVASGEKIPATAPPFDNEAGDFATVAA
jgi:hypothetical protein